MFAPKRILVPTDFSPSSRAALEHAAELAERFRSTLVALHVCAPPSLSRADDAATVAGGRLETLGDLVHRQAREEMDAFLAPLIERPGLWFRRQIEVGDPVDTILQVAEDGEFDLVVMGTHGRAGLKRVLLGSVAEKVARTACCPVLTIRDQAAEPAELERRT